MDFDPASDMLRVITRNGSNYRVNPNAGNIFAQDTSLFYTGHVPSQTPDNVALAYRNDGTLFTTPSTSTNSPASAASAAIH